MTQLHTAGTSPALWTKKHFLLLGGFLAAGVAGLVAGYAGTSGTLRVSRQVAWVNVAGAALLISGAGVVLFLTAARRSIGQRRLSLFGDVAGVEPAPLADATTMAAADLVSAPTMTRYHRADCPFVAGKAALTVGTTVDHEKVGRRPCGVCLPGGAS